MEDERDEYRQMSGVGKTENTAGEDQKGKQGKGLNTLESLTSDDLENHQSNVFCLVLSITISLCHSPAENSLDVIQA